MRFRLGIGRQKDKKQLSPNSGENQEVSLNGDAAIAEELDSKSKPADFGSKDEAFFDSQAWLDSDCEDDFVSVDGDFGPSRGSTPNNQISSQNAPQSNKNSSTDTLPGTNSEPSLTDGKKRLAQLLLQENQVEEIVSKQSTENGQRETNEKPDFGKASNSQLQMLSSNETPSKELKHKEEDDMRSKQHCCLPRLAQSLSFKERKKHNSGPIRSNIS